MVNIRCLELLPGIYLLSGHERKECGIGSIIGFLHVVEGYGSVVFILACHWRDVMEPQPCTKVKMVVVNTG